MVTNLPLTNAESPLRRRLRIEYFDQNESFASQLPRLGMIEQELAFADSPGPWYLVRLDAPVFYQEQRYSQLLLKSRWEGYPVNGQAETSVFMLLVPEVSLRKQINRTLSSSMSPGVWHTPSPTSWFSTGARNALRAT